MPSMTYCMAANCGNKEYRKQGWCVKHFKMFVSPARIPHDELREESELISGTLEEKAHRLGVSSRTLRRALNGCR